MVKMIKEEEDDTRPTLVETPVGVDGFHTKQGLMKAFVLQVFVHEQAFIAFQAAATELHEVAMLDPSYELHFIQKLLIPLA